MPEGREVVYHIKKAIWRVDGAYYALRHMHPAIALDILSGAVTSLVVVADRAKDPRVKRKAQEERERLGRLDAELEERLMRHYYDGARLDVADIAKELRAAHDRLLTLYKLAVTGYE